MSTALPGWWVGDEWKQISAGSHHTCAIKSDDSLHCWGNNIGGQLTATEFSAPYRLTGVQTWCSSPAGKAGTIIYNADFNVMQYCDGAGWVGIRQ